LMLLGGAVLAFMGENGRGSSVVRRTRRAS
jgi:hypothetical protein